MPAWSRTSSSSQEPSRNDVDEFFRGGMWLNTAAAMGVEDLSAKCEWMRAEAAAAASDED